MLFILLIFIGCSCFC
ncbi:hypothetical protein COM00_26770 [Bacillus toyonensis]|nr:hypothetical protein CN638_11090 [Bacillus toyonensis]PEP75426.1 hypothetical protein CN581_26970 [Bacillus toyonensis]PGB57007.1 hypothetical protein COM00_26770 [Bacillus toyonensis]